MVNYVGRIGLRRLDANGKVIEKGEFFKRRDTVAISERYDNISIHTDILSAYQDAVKISNIVFTDGWELIPDSVGVDMVRTLPMGPEEVDSLLKDGLKQRILGTLNPIEKELFAKFFG